MKKLTPVMAQYFEIKEKHQDAILFFRFGDFYEMFYDDAKTASRILQIALTTRDKSSENPIPMCGIPYFASETYLKKLVDAGCKVSICEQMESSSEAKGIVKREVVRVVTPGTYEPENPKKNSYILSFYPEGNMHGIAISDVSTGDFIIYESSESLIDEVDRYEPREILCPGRLEEDIHYSEILRDHFVSYYSDFSFDYTEAYKTLLSYFKVTSLDGFGCENLHRAIPAAGGLLSYLVETQKSQLTFNRIKVANTSSYMIIDAVSKRNLELLTNIRDNSGDFTLLWILDHTLTPMGGRLLRENIAKPLINKEEIENRLNKVEEMYMNFELLENLRAHLKKVQDIERLTARILKGVANARDVTAIKTSVEEISQIKKLIKRRGNDLFKQFHESIRELQQMTELIDNAITDSPPNSIKDGGIIKTGYHSEVDELREISQKGRNFLTEMEQKEKSRTGINFLKIGYNKVYGYYIEVTKSNVNMVPEHYIRKQTLTSGERYITEELKEYENKIVGADERLKNIEYELFKNLVEKLKIHADELWETSANIAVIDFLQSLALAAKRNNYTKPVIMESSEIEITDGRHPVLEAVTEGDRFIPNDVHMDGEENKLLIITGPNMAGKSTFMRQTAIIVLMAQLGSFVPAEKARIGIADRIFTRIGASDYLAKGQSTFMVEMIETANIINNATGKSLILLDEVGRGTSTFDGISIAWAVAEHIADKVNARTLFATHYNELTELSITTEGVKNYNISVKEWGDEIIFLRKIVKGSADKSYGIQVARLAGLPEAVITRSKEILSNLEKDEISETGEPKFAVRKKKKPAVQLDLFAEMTNPVITMLSQTNLDNIKPDQAVQILMDLKKLASKDD